MYPVSPRLFMMGPEYEVHRDGTLVGKAHGLPDKKDGHIAFHAETDLQQGDRLVGTVTRIELPVLRVEPEVSRTRIILKKVYTTAPREDRSRSIITQNIGTVHGGVAGRDFTGNVILDMSVGDVLNYLTNAIEKTADFEEKKSLLQKIGEFTKHPIVTNIASTGIDSVAKWLTGTT